MIDDQELIRSSVRHALEAARIQVVGEAATAEAGIRTVLDLRPTSC